MFNFIFTFVVVDFLRLLGEADGEMEGWIL
jgi:hypothetical protein